MKQVIEEFRIYRAMPIGWHDLYDADIEVRGQQADEYRIVFGAQFDESGERGEFCSVERRDGAAWVDATPLFYQRYVAGHKGEIEYSRHEKRLCEFVAKRVPLFRRYLAEDLAAVEEIVE